MLFLWFTQQREKGIPIFGPVLKEKAAAFAMNWEEQFKDFAASKGWLGKWKNCYEIRQLVIYGEKLSAD